MLLVALAFAVPGFEASHPAAGVHNFLFAGVEGMASRADINPHLTGS